MSDYTFEVSEFIGTFTFNRPEVLNAITFEMYADLRDLMASLQTDETIKVVVLTGGGRAFCSGGDVHNIIGDLLEADMRAHLEFTRMTGAVVRNMRRLEKPIIAALNGLAAGAGAVIALASDLRVIAEDAGLQFLFTNVGLTGGDMGAAYLLPRIVGASRAYEILALGERVTASEAQAMGLVNRVVPADEVLQTAMELARRLAEGPSLALGITKRLLVDEWSMDLESAIESEAQAQALMMMGEDHRIFYEAFSTKSKPEFKGR